jgi:hypothetical protein
MPIYHTVVRIGPDRIKAFCRSLSNVHPYVARISRCRETANVFKWNQFKVNRIIQALKLLA